MRPRLAGKAPHPVLDSWLDDGFHFFVFALGDQGTRAGTETVALAVFAMHPDQREPVSAITVISTETGRHVRITDLRDPESSYVAPLPGSAAAG